MAARHRRAAHGHIVPVRHDALEPHDGTGALAGTGLQGYVRSPETPRQERDAHFRNRAFHGRQSRGACWRYTTADEPHIGGSDGGMSKSRERSDWAR
jgi:hypothetical protein